MVVRLTPWGMFKFFCKIALVWLRRKRNTWVAGYCWFVKIPVVFLWGFLEPNSLHWFYFWVNDKQLELILDIWFLLFHPRPSGFGCKSYGRGTEDFHLCGTIQHHRFLWSSVALQRCLMLIACSWFSCKAWFGVWNWGFGFHILLTWTPLQLHVFFYSDPKHICFCPFCKNNKLHSEFGTAWCI